MHASHPVRACLQTTGRRQQWQVCGRGSLLTLHAYCHFYCCLLIAYVIFVEGVISLNFVFHVAKCSWCAVTDPCIVCFSRCMDGCYALLGWVTEYQEMLEEEHGCCYYHQQHWSCQGSVSFLKYLGSLTFNLDILHHKIIQYQWMQIGISVLRW